MNSGTLQDSSALPFSGQNEGNVLYCYTSNYEWLFFQCSLHSSMGLINGKVEVGSGFCGAN